MKTLSFFLISFLMLSSQVMARCQNPEPGKAYPRADAVVLVRIISVENLPENVASMNVEVLQSWKSKVTDNTKTLSIFSGTMDCSYVGKEGETHLLYLNKRKGPPEGFWTGNCMGNWPESYPQAAKHIKWLNRYGRKA